MNKDQFKFAQDVIALMLFIWEKGFRVSFGEAHRTKEQQLLYFHGFTIEETDDSIKLVESRKLSKTKDSRHIVRMAIDFNFFKPDTRKFTLTYEKDELQQFGDYWESLDEKNSWGGNWNFVDTPHFERKQ